ncbi:MAG: hypothetical protein AB1427_06820 [Thermodesulfobacteriota bacterium]
MENIQRNLAKEIAALQSSKPSRKNRHWTLLFVGDHGKVVTIRWFRWIITLWAFLLGTAVVVSGAFYFLYHHNRNETVGLQRSMDQMQQQLARLRNDKEVLMTRLVVAETEMEKLRGKMGPKQGEKATGDRQDARSKKELRPDSQIAQPAEAAVSKPEGSPPPNVPVAQESVLKVSIEEFNVSHETASDTFRAQFVLRNSGPDLNPVSGYTAVILKKLNAQPDKWLTLPTLRLAAGVPTGNKRGQYFSIARFKTVRFMVKSKMEPDQFDSATVYVFDANGNLLIEKDFSINIQETVFTPNQ